MAIVTFAMWVGKTKHTMVVLPPFPPIIVVWVSSTFESGAATISISSLWAIN